jgi:hypothetical protein
VQGSDLVYEPIRPPKKVKYNRKQLAQGPELQQRYTDAVKNRYQVLTEDNNGSKYDEFVQANREAMVECLPKRTRSKKLLRSMMTD